MKKKNLANLIIFLNALIIYFPLVLTSVSSFHSCWDLYQDDPYIDPHDWCGSEKEFFLGAIRRASIYWTIVSVLMLIIFLAVKESEIPKKTHIVQKSIIKQQEIITSPSVRTPAHPNFCPDCGSKIKDINQKFCVNCGKELSDVI